MFTGIIEEKGVIKAIKKNAKSSSLSISASKIFEGLKIGDSVATNGVCLTVTSISQNILTADVMNETLMRSNLGDLQIGKVVNLERAMLANGRFDGHMVSGHIDGVGKIVSIRKDDIAIWYQIKADDKIMKYIVEKGSVCIDGISLTVAKVERDTFFVSVIPHTAKETTLSEKVANSTVNIENDMVAKYIEKFMMKKQAITKEFLFENGF